MTVLTSLKLWSSQCAFNLNSWKSNLKKKGVNGTRTHDLAIPVKCSIHWAIKPHGKMINCEFVIYPMIVNIHVWIYENHICELRINMSEIVILAVCFQLKQLKKQPEKNSGLNGAWTHDFAVPVQCSIHWAIKPHGEMVNCEFVIYPMIVNIHVLKLYIIRGNNSISYKRIPWLAPIDCLPPILWEVASLLASLGDLEEH